MVARSIMIDPRRPWLRRSLGPHIKLKLDHLGKEVLESRLPGICEALAPSPTWIGQRAHPHHPDLPLHDGRRADQRERPVPDPGRDGNDVPVVGLFSVGGSPASPCTVPAVWVATPAGSGGVRSCCGGMPGGDPWFDGHGVEATDADIARRWALQPLGKQP